MSLQNRQTGMSLDSIRLGRTPKDDKLKLLKKRNHEKQLCKWNNKESYSNKDCFLIWLSYHLDLVLRIDMEQFKMNQSKKNIFIC